MSEFDFTSFAMWGVITGIAMLVIGLTYRRYLKRNNLFSQS
jgi:hypothetical protein